MPSRRPNVIVVLVDQLRATEVGCYGNPVIRTPHLDALAASGTRFEQAVTNQPVCCPARSALLSGQYGRTCTGELGNMADDPPCATRRRLLDPTLPEVLQAAGYRTALIGKWHIDPSPLVVGFAEAHHPIVIHRYVGQRYFTQGVLSGTPVPGYAPAHELRCVEEFLAAPGDRPFLLYYNISLPHGPIGTTDLPPRYAAMYDPATMPLRPNVYRDGVPAYDEFWFKIYTSWDYFWRLANAPCWNTQPECGYPDPTTGELPRDVLEPGFDLRRLYALYYGATTWVDDLVGGLLAALKRHGLDEHTIVVFTSDHGDNLGSHQFFNKDVLFEESLRVPLFIRGPGLPVGAVNAGQLAATIDIMPTVLDLCGVPIPATVQGQSLAPVLRTATPTLPRNHAFIETDPGHYGRPAVGLRTPTHIYGAFTEGKAGALSDCWGFYDLIADPLQEHDLQHDPAHAHRRDELRAQLLAWHTTTPWLPVAEPGTFVRLQAPQK